MSFGSNARSVRKFKKPSIAGRSMMSSRSKRQNADTQSVNSFMKRNQGVLQKIKFALAGQTGPDGEDDDQIKFNGGDDGGMDFD